MKHVFRLLLVALFTGALLASGCAAPLHPPTLTPTATPSYTTRIDRQEQKWNQSGITDYHLVMKFYENFANGLETQRDVIVKGGKVVKSSCKADLCPAFVFTSVETVDDLFWVARGGTLPEATYKKTPDPGSSLDECLHGISFDPTYGFPTYVSIDCPKWDDEDNWVQVVSFEIIK